jgi:hypothetical protein
MKTKPHFLYFKRTAAAVLLSKLTQDESAAAQRLCRVIALGNYPRIPVTFGPWVLWANGVN